MVVSWGSQSASRSGIFTEGKSMMRVALALLAAAGFVATARGETLTGALEEPAIRRKAELVYLEKVEGTFAPPADPVVVNQRNNVYVPHLVTVLAGTKVTFLSEDSELHNVYARQGKDVLFNQAQLPKMKFEKTFAKPGPIHLTCNVHKEMSAWVVVLQNPFSAKPDPKTGAYVIEGVPPGSYTLRVWGEGLKEEELARKYPVAVEPTAAAPAMASKKK
jgi:plastocyanin